MKKSSIFLFILAFSLTAFTSVNKSNKELLPTSLRITVLNELGNPVEGASVTLFKTEADYDNEENPVQETLKTDEKGRVTFKQLEPIEYYVNAQKDDLNNYGGGTKTGKLHKGKFNKANIVIN